MRSPEAWRDISIKPEYKRVDEILGQKPPSFARRLRENWELLTGVALLTTWHCGAVLVIIGDDKWKNAGAAITFATISAPVGVFLALKTARRINHLVDRIQRFIGSIYFDSKT